MFYGYSKTHFGFCFIVWQDQELKHLAFMDSPDKEKWKQQLPKTIRLENLIESTEQAEDFINIIFSDSARFPLLMAPDGTEFQKRVWKALQTIAYGHVVSYQDVAHMIKHPRAVRATARAIAHNPIAYLIPCHRVLPKAGGLGGFRWGFERKYKLLAVEQQ